MLYLVPKKDVEKEVGIEVDNEVEENRLRGRGEEKRQRRESGREKVLKYRRG